ncbi:ribosome-inactivating family protein [Streptomyces sp. NPDC037389]|uniref:ribosome-inactivating family protein n=1 Tax=Streptomyces sp. NPDC037389 TaxID=3155369 RepID=UPI00340FEB24
MRVPRRPLNAANAAVIAATTVAAAVMATGAAFAAPGPAGPAVMAPPAAQAAVAYPNPVLDTEKATAKDYRKFVQDLRLRATGGKVFKDRMYALDPGATKDLFPVRLTTAKGSVDLVVRASDLYVVGWYTEQNNTFHSIKEGKTNPVYMPKKDTKQDPLKYDGAYGTLEGRASGKATRLNVVLGRENTKQSVINLMSTPADGGEAAKALLVLVQEASEAARFTKIDALVAAGWTGGSVGERALINDLENDWGNFCTWAVKKLKNQPVEPHTLKDGKTFATLDAAQEYLAIVKQ